MNTDQWPSSPSQTSTASTQNATFSNPTTTLASAVMTLFTRLRTTAFVSTAPHHVTPNPFFPQATNPVWVPSEAEIPTEWQPKLGKVEHRRMFNFWLFVIALVGLAVLIPALWALWK
ncbi:hypothetical protein GMOD_00007747 [Pyrenophora seminiperda CCB06]|uniref:Uncharacterized protein n=1 Tax=Pyrenophora seminiperda CCB06 TaxID=1302712 RepID=A0A3M7MDZ7_9PLEO|nr:hypothetical protein GMOD_00007747 [Pyrenophora seminiperda CCB06]